MKKQKLAIFFFTIFFLAAPLLVSAVDLVRCGGPDDPPCGVSDIFVLVARTTNTLIALAGIFAVYKIIGAGWNFTIAMGNEEKLTASKNQITNAVLGLALVMAAFMIINTVANYVLLGAGPNKACKIDLQDPLNYLYIHSNPAEHAKCRE